MSFLKRLKETRRRYGPPTTEQIDKYRKIAKNKSYKYIRDKSRLPKSSEFKELGKIKLHAERIHIDRGGYDRRGRYWGTGQKLYLVHDYQFDINKYVRAENAKLAKDKVLNAIKKYGYQRLKYMDLN